MPDSMLAVKNVGKRSVRSASALFPGRDAVFPVNSTRSAAARERRAAEVEPSAKFPRGVQNVDATVVRLWRPLDRATIDGATSVSRITRMGERTLEWYVPRSARPDVRWADLRPAGGRLGEAKRH